MILDWQWNRLGKIFAPLDRFLMSLLLLTLGIGLVIQYSASDMNLATLLQHSIRIGFSLLALLVVANLPPKYLRQLTLPLFIGNVVLLVLVSLYGTGSGGATRWLAWGALNLQPSELLKLTVPMTIALIISQQPRPPSFFWVLFTLVILGGCCFLVSQQPDLGTALVIFLIGFSVVFLSGISYWWITGMLVLSSMALPLIWKFFLLDYQKERIHILFNPESDPLGQGYNVMQSKIAIGSGGVSGRGWTESTQAQFDFLPEHATDFIFSIYAEEFGLVGVTVLILLYLMILWRILTLSRISQDAFARLLIGGLSVSFLLHVIINIAMTIGYAPIVGLPLPLMSVGGSAMITFLLGFGIIFSFHHNALKSR